jgi:hypothetical protein
MNKIKLIATFCMFLIVMLPVCMADEFEQEGETLIIEAKQYEPEVLRSDYMEQLNIPVRVILGAIRGEPISLPEIGSVSVKLIKKQEAQKKNASVEGTSEQMIKDYVQGTPKWHKAPYPTLDNLGYVEITLKKIEKETEVPKQIDLDFEATINYEAEIAGFTIGGENQKELMIATVPTIKENPEEYKILGGRYYLRVTDITSTGASVEVLDSEFARLTSKTLKLGEASSSITLSYKDQAEPDHIRLKLEEVRGVGEINLEINGKTKTFEKNKEIERGWKVSNLYTGTKESPDDDYIILQNKEFKAPVVLSIEDKFNEVSELKTLIGSCDKSECTIYANSRIPNLKIYAVNKELLTQALTGLEDIKLTKLVSVGTQTTGRLAKIQIGGLEQPYAEGHKIGLEKCECKISSITRDEVRISGVKKCNSGERTDYITLKTGESNAICGTVLEIRGITTDEKAVITILPGTGKGKTTTYFSVHIPVEKRAIQYTPEELQEKINRTEALIKKLDGTITQLQTLVEGWTKVCLATMAVFTVMAFMQGVSGTSPKKETGTGTGTGTGTSTTTEEPKPMTLPTGVNAWSELEYGYKSTTTGYKLENTKYLFINGNEMRPENDQHLGIYVGAKLRHKSGVYVLTPEGTLIKGSDKDYWNWGAGQGSGKFTTSFSQSGGMAVGIQNCNQIPQSTIGEKTDYQDMCRYAQNTYGSALVLEFSKADNHMAVRSIGPDGKFNTQDDRVQFYIAPDSSTFRELKKELTALEDAYKRGEKNPRFRNYEYPNTGTFASGGSSGDVDCRVVMSEGQCKILFNACDPVMCPPSRCNLGGKVRPGAIDNVIQSGLIGSLILCLPNIKDGVIMPVCLSGILAALKNIRSVLQGYVDCLKTALNDQKSVGICDRIRSIWMCQILWKEAMTILNMVGGNFFDKAAGSGGGEYFGLKGGVENAKTTVDFFTNSYAKSVFASYTGKSTKDLGAVICEKAIYGKGPLLGDIVEDITKAQNPTQFMAYVEEEVLYQATEQKSTYKLFYHIYAGAQPIDYKIYVKQSSTGKTYVCKECSGRLEAEGYIDKSTLFTLEPKYNIICVKIGSKEECNMGRVVSTSYGINAANNYLSEYELSKKVTTQDECTADVRGMVPNVQIEKMCSSLNPGTGKGDDQIKLWKVVGSCGKNKDGVALGDCWMKLGELEKYNPEAYKGITEKLCEGTICQQHQSCEGMHQTTTVSGYKTVICCKGTCKDDENYIRTVQTLEEQSFLKETAYKEMYDYGKSYCESTEFSNNNPFSSSSSIPASWLEKGETVKADVRNEEQKNIYHFFKGMMYLICGNCIDAPKEFDQITAKTSDYFIDACGKNEVSSGGLMYDRCSRVCSGTPQTTPTTTPTTETPAATKILKPTKITLITPSNKDGEPISISDAKEIKLTTGGAYTVKDITFYESVKSCYFNFGTDLTKPQVNKLGTGGTTICKFGDTGFSIVGNAEGLKIEIGGLDEKSGEEFASTFDVKVLEEAVSNQWKFLLCKVLQYNTEERMCISTLNRRCSDYCINGVKYSWLGHYDNIGDCVTEMKNAGSYVEESKRSVC